MKMKAAICVKYGAPEVIQIQERDIPVPGDHEILVRIRASVVGPADCAMRTGKPFLVRFFSGLTKPKHIPGDLLAGEVAAIGNAVSLFRVGDRVFGSTLLVTGAHAEYKCLPESGVVTKIPDSLGFAEAASLCEAFTPLTFLRDKAKLGRGQHLLINGAAGALGVYAIQIAKHYGAEVTAVCSAANFALVKSLGADQVLDYKVQDFAKTGKSYDLIFDAVAKRSFPQVKAALKPAGSYYTTFPSPGVLLRMVFSGKRPGKKAIFVAAGLEQTREKMEFLAALFESGAIKPVIDRRFPLDQIADAHRYVDTGHKKGSAVIVI